MSDQRKFAQLQPFTLAGSGVAIGAGSVILSSFQTIDGVNLAMADFGTKGFGTIDPGNGTKEEPISFTGVTQNANGTATLTGVKTVSFLAPYTEVANVAKSHAGGAFFVISNTSAFYNDFANKNDDETITQTWTFTDPNYPKMDVYVAPTVNEQFAPKKYVDDIAIAGAPDATTGVKGIVEIATQAEVNAGTALGGTGASLAVRPPELAVAVQNSVHSYATDAQASDTYVITLTPAPTAYALGQQFVFKANTINTGAATLNVNGLGAITIKKNHDQDLETGDIEAGSIVTVVYDSVGPVFQLQTQQASMPTTALLQESATFFSTTDITGAEAETLSSGPTSNASSLHTHSLSSRIHTSYNVTVSNTAAESTLFTTTIPGGTLGTTNAVRIVVNIASFALLNTAGDDEVSFALKYGGSTIKTWGIENTSGAGYTGLQGKFEFYLISRGTTGTQTLGSNIIIGERAVASGSGLLQAVDYLENSQAVDITVAVDSSINQTLAFTVDFESASASNAVTMTTAIVEALKS